MANVSKYPKEVQEFIAAHSTEYSREELSQELKARFGFEKTASALSSWCKARKYYSRKREGRLCPELSKYPAEMHPYIRSIAYGRSYKEIAKMMNLSDQQVQVYLFRARTNLKKKLQKTMI